MGGFPLSQKSLVAGLERPRPLPHTHFKQKSSSENSFLGGERFSLWTRGSPRPRSLEGQGFCNVCLKQRARVSRKGAILFRSS